MDKTKLNFLKETMLFSRAQFWSALLNHVYPEQQVKHYSANETVDYFRKLRQIRKQAKRAENNKKG